VGRLGELRQRKLLKEGEDLGRLIPLHHGGSSRQAAPLGGWEKKRLGGGGAYGEINGLG